MAIRLAIGGGRRRIVGQLLIEAMILSTAGGVLGVALAAGATKALAATLVQVIPMVLAFDPTPDVRVVAAAFAFCTISTVFFGLGPALRLSRTDVVSELKQQPSDIRGRRRRVGMRGALVVAQVALSLALLTAGGLFLSGALKATAADPGFRLDKGLLASVDASLASMDETRGRETYRQLMARLRSIPGIESASLASMVPYGEFSDGRSVKPVGATDEEADYAFYTVVGADYFRTLNLPVMRGREFTHAEEELPSPIRPVIVNDVLARRLWPDQDPLGQQIQFTGREASGPEPSTMEVVGVVGSVRHSLFDREAVAGLYVPFGDRYQGGMNLHLRTRAGDRASESSALQAVQREIKAVDQRLPVLALKTLRDHRDSSIYMWIARTGANLFVTFGLAALLLASIGVYGVQAYTVSRRTREFGIRMALGATQGALIRMVLAEGLWLALLGLGIGLTMSVPFTFLLSSWVYGVGPFEPLVLAGAPAVLVASAMLACYVPARRAMAIAPVTALRCD
jgi:predicted permease